MKQLQREDASELAEAQHGLGDPQGAGRFEKGAAVELPQVPWPSPFREEFGIREVKLPTEETVEVMTFAGTMIEALPKKAQTCVQTVWEKLKPYDWAVYATTALEGWKGRTVDISSMVNIREVCGGDEECIGQCH